MTPAEALDLLKMRDYRGGALLIAGDPMAKKLLAAWAVTPLIWIPPTSEAPADTDHNGLWDWIWEDTEIDLDLLSRRSGVPYSFMEPKLTILVASRLIFPDGTISDFAEKILASDVARELGVIRRGRRLPPAPPAQPE